MQEWFNFVPFEKPLNNGAHFEWGPRPTDIDPVETVNIEFRLTSLRSNCLWVVKIIILLIGSWIVGIDTLMACFRPMPREYIRDDPNKREGGNEMASTTDIWRCFEQTVDRVKAFRFPIL